MTAPADPKGPVTLREMAAGVRDEFIQWDRGTIGTFLQLMWRPADVLRGYVWDRDPRYVKPWRYLTFCIVINIALTWFVLDQLGYRALLQTHTLEMRQASYILNNAAVLSVLSIPFMAAVMRLCFAGLQIRYVDALVLLCYTQGQASLLGLAGTLTAMLSHSVIAAVAVSSLTFAYFLWAWTVCATGPLWRRIVASVLTLIVGESINGAIVLAAAKLLA